MLLDQWNQTHLVFTYGQHAQLFCYIWNIWSPEEYFQTDAIAHILTFWLWNRSQKNFEQKKAKPLLDKKSNIQQAIKSSSWPSLHIKKLLKWQSQQLLQGLALLMEIATRLKFKVPKITFKKTSNILDIHQKVAKILCRKS